MDQMDFYRQRVDRNPLKEVIRPQRIGSRPLHFEVNGHQNKPGFSRSDLCAPRNPPPLGLFTQRLATGRRKVYDALTRKLQRQMGLQMFEEI